MGNLTDALWDVTRAAVARAFKLSQPTEQRQAPAGANLSPDKNTRDGMPTTREFARHFEDNSDVANAVVSDLVDSIVGDGLTLIPKVRANGLSDGINTQITRLLEEWMEPGCEATGQLQWSAVERMACRAWLRDGEQFGQHVIGGNRGYQFASDQIPYTIEMIESDFCPFDLNSESSVNRSSRRRVVNGVEINEWSQPRAYRFWRQHPGGDVPIEMNTKRVPAEQIVHLALRTRWPQVRGVTLFHAAGLRLHDLYDYDESERLRARVQAHLAAWMTKQPAPRVGVRGEGDAKRRVVELPQATVIDDLLPGEEIHLSQTGAPNPELTNFHNMQIRAICAGTGARFSRVARLYESSYSAMRQELVDSVAMARGPRKDFIWQWITPIYRNLIDVALLTGRLTVPADLPRRELYRFDWIAPGVPWIDPKKEVEADILAIKAGIMDTPMVQRRRGINPANVEAPEQLELTIDEQQTETEADEDE